MADPRMPAPTIAPAPPPPPPTSTLNELAASINNHLASISETYRGNVLRAFEVGKLLKDAKAKVGHGNFEQWVKENCKELSKSTAERFMKLAENRKAIEEKMKTKNVTVTDLSVRGALALAKPSNGSASAEPAKIIGGNDPVSAVHALGDKYFKALQTLKHNDHEKAKAVASAIVKRLHDAELL